MALGINEILDVIVSHAQATGHFQTVNEHESKQSQTNGISAAVWIEKLTPVRSSGLASTTVRLELELRLYSSTYMDPYDDIDSNLVIAADALFSAYIGDFDLGSTSRQIDIFGAYGQPLEARAGYINVDGKEFRVLQVRLPIILNDVWAQSP